MVTAALDVQYYADNGTKEVLVEEYLVDGGPVLDDDTVGGRVCELTNGGKKTAARDIVGNIPGG